MAFVDEVTIKAKAGDGGDGVVRWRHTRETEFGGPSGGDGGRGGNVYAVGVRDAHVLSRYRAEKEFVAQRGEDGKSSSLHGANGKDLEIRLPIGSLITNTDTNDTHSITEEGERILLLSGGAGGRGNESFKSSTNPAPQKATSGKPGEEAEFHIELELIADIGVIGLPNAGKTTLLNSLTRAHGKVGAYPFTTIEPALGECYGYILADIPGLIEGAAEGRGLGHAFLRHVRRTKMLAHCISLENDDIEKAYRTVREELDKFDPALAGKKEVIVLTKTDVIEDPKQITSARTRIERALQRPVFVVSFYDDAQIKELRDALLKEVKSGE